MTLGEPSDRFVISAACERDVGDVVVAFDIWYCVELVDETLVERTETGTVDCEVDDRTLAASRLVEVIDAGDADLEGGRTADHSPGPLFEGDVLRPSRITEPLYHERVLVADGVEFEEVGMQVSCEPFDLPRNRHVEAVHCAFVG